MLDEQPVQLVSETRQPIPATPGKPKRVAYECVREGTCTVWMFVEPLGGWRDVRVTARKTAVDWAEQVRNLVDHPRFRDADKITLVSDNLNTHDIGSFYQAFLPNEAMRLARKLEFVPSPKHGSWLNMAEPELSVLTRQCLGDRIASEQEVTDRSTAWSIERNDKQVGVDWTFTTENARIKLKRLYPRIKT